MFVCKHRNKGVQGSTFALVLWHVPVQRPVLPALPHVCHRAPTPHASLCAAGAAGAKNCFFSTSRSSLKKNYPCHPGYKKIPLCFSSGICKTSAAVCWHLLMAHDSTG